MDADQHLAARSSNGDIWCHFQRRRRSIALASAKGHAFLELIWIYSSGPPFSHLFRAIVHSTQRVANVFSKCLALRSRAKTSSYCESKPHLVAWRFWDDVGPWLRLRSSVRRPCGMFSTQVALILVERIGEDMCNVGERMSC